MQIMSPNENSREASISDVNILKTSVFGRSGESLNNGTTWNLHCLVFKEFKSVSEIFISEMEALGKFSRKPLYLTF